MQNLTPAGEAFLARWQSDYPDVLPISHTLKWHFPKRWMRFHSLPDARRYARVKEDMDVILMRQNAIIGALVSPGTRIEIVLSRLDADCHLFVSENLTPMGAFADESAEEPMQAWLTRDVWQSGGLDIMLTLIADDQARAIIIGSDCLIAPYDGGVDVITKDAFTAHALKRQFVDWAPLREDGL